MYQDGVPLKNCESMKQWVKGLEISEKLKLKLKLMNWLEDFLERFNFALHHYELHSCFSGTLFWFGLHGMMGRFGVVNSGANGYGGCYWLTAYKFPPIRVKKRSVDVYWNRLLWKVFNPSCARHRLCRETWALTCLMLPVSQNWGMR